MEIRIVGWHTKDAPYECHDCHQHADYLVVGRFAVTNGIDESYEMEDDFNLCGDCANSSRYQIRRDEIAEVFKKLGF